MKYLFLFLALLIICSCDSATQPVKKNDQPIISQTKPEVQTNTKKTYTAGGVKPKPVNSENKNTGNTITIPLGEYDAVVDFSKMTFTSDEEEQMTKQTIGLSQFTISFVSENNMSMRVKTQDKTINDAAEYFMRNDSLFLTRSDGQQPVYSVRQSDDGKFFLQNPMNMNLVLTKK